jgi:hypothetical protein
MDVDVAPIPALPVCIDSNAKTGRFPFARPR